LIEYILNPSSHLPSWAWHSQKSCCGWISKSDNHYNHRR